ncbi:MAG: acetyl-CoA carboxylase biotin carboxyl carrier protein [Bacteroidota bacterium]|nr:acetyl-CoA carboxylase biotin carboxyl carrier protein [Bacteroidota bacterium]
MDLRDIQNLIKFVAKSGATEVKLEMEDVKITIKTNSSTEGSEPMAYVQHIPVPNQVIAQPQVVATQPVVAAGGDAPTTTSDESKYLVVKSPMIGTFYRKPAPDKPAFVEVGNTIAEGDVLCVIEAMKLFNEIESEFSGKIVKVLVDDATPVEFDQPLFLVDPS